MISRDASERRSPSPKAVPALSLVDSNRTPVSPTLAPTGTSRTPTGEVAAPRSIEPRP